MSGAIWKFSEAEGLRNKIVDPAWYVLNILEHRPWSPSKMGDSNNCYFDCVIVKNADTGSTEYAGVPIELMFNDKPKAQGFREVFMRALGVDWKYNTEYNMASAVGKQVEAFIENNEWNGRITNKCQHKYRLPR